MPLDPKFQAASEAAESWLNTVSLVINLCRAASSDPKFEGSIGPAFELLLPTEGVRFNLQDDYLEHAEILAQLNDELAALSDGPVTWEHGRGLSALAHVPNAVYPHVWSSAHEAAAAIARMALALLAEPLVGITDPAERWAEAKRLATRWKALTLPRAEVAALQERIRRERAKLLRQAPRELEAEIGESPAEQPTIWYHDGQSYSADGQRPVSVSNEQHNVLKAFLDVEIALSTKALQTAGASNVTTVIDKLVKKFPKGAIRRPVKKGDGYYIRVRSLPKPN